MTVSRSSPDTLNSEHTLLIFLDATTKKGACMKNSEDELSDYLYALRVAQGLTQTEVAKEIGYTQVILSQWESGSRSPSTEAMESLAKIYRVDVDKIMRKNDSYWRKKTLRAIEGMKESEFKQLYNFIEVHIGVYDPEGSGVEYGTQRNERKGLKRLS